MAKKFVSASYGKGATKTTPRNDCNEKMGTPNIQNLQHARFQTITQPNADYRGNTRGNKEVTSEVTPEATRQMHRVRRIMLGVMLPLMLPLCYLWCYLLTASKCAGSPLYRRFSGKRC